MNQINGDVAIIGGGITALSAAWHLQQQGIPYVVYEKTGRWGGKVQTERLTTAAGTFILDAGPESFITRKPEVWELAQQLGLHNEILPLRAEVNGAHVMHNGVIYPLPLSPSAFFTTPLLSWSGRLRVLAEPFIPPRRDDADESLADFASRRLGAEMADRVIGPILGGIYNTDYQRQSVLVSAPQMRVIEREHGSLVRGLLATMRRNKTPDSPPRFITFQDGAEGLVRGLLEQLQGEMLLNTPVHHITPNPNGRWTLDLGDNRQRQPAAVILATPANASAHMLESAAPAAAALLRALRQTSIGTVFLSFRTADLPALNATSVMIPRREQRPIDALLLTSQRMPHRAPEGYTLIKIFFGGAMPQTMTLTDDELLRVILAELKTLLGINAVPVFHRVFRWHSSYPEAHIGHLDQVARVESALPPGLFLAGSSYRGIGVPDCIRQGYHAANAAGHWLTHHSMKEQVL